MGAYNILLWFDKLAKYNGLLKRKFSPGCKDALPTPMALFLSSTLGLIWLSVVLALITCHEMGLGNKGNYVLYGFYISHLLVGCFVPLFYSILVKDDFYWARFSV